MGVAEGLSRLLPRVRIAVLRAAPNGPRSCLLAYGPTERPSRRRRWLLACRLTQRRMARGPPRCVYRRMARSHQLLTCLKHQYVHLT